MTVKKPAQEGSVNGSVASATIPRVAFGSSQAEIEQWARYNGLGMLARQVFLDRNAQGFKKVIKRGAGDVLDHTPLSATIKRDARPFLRAVIHHARLARDALLRGDLQKFEHMRDVARMHLAQAGASQRQPFMEARRRSVSGGNRGGRPPNQHVGEWSQSVAEKMARNPSLSRTEAMKKVADDWNIDNDPPIKWTALRDAFSNQKRKVK